MFALRSLAPPALRAAATRAMATQMSASEALVETMIEHGTDRVFGIVGSAFIDPLDLFPAAGIEFVDVQHEQNAVHMAEGYHRLSGKPGVVIGQNGPGISNMVTGVATAFMNHTPVVLISPQAGSNTFGWGGFQEIDQLPMFSNITKYQAQVPCGSRMSEIVGRAFDRAKQLRGPTQVNIPRNMFNEVHEYEIAAPITRSPAVPDPDTVREILSAVERAQRPMILAGGGLERDDAVIRLAEKLNCPIATTYLHNRSVRDCPNNVGSLGYMGSKAAMWCTVDADLVLALGTRINPFGVTKQYGLDYWDPNKPLIQVDINPDALGVTCKPTIAVCADANATAELMVQATPTKRNGLAIPFKYYKQKWAKELCESSQQPSGQEKQLRPKAALEVFRSAIGPGTVVTTDIGHCCSQALSYLQDTVLLTAGTFGSCGTAIPMALGARMADSTHPVFALVGDGAVNMQGLNELLTAARYNPGITIVVFRNNVWGAELLNQLIWTDARAVGTKINNPPIHKIAESMGIVGWEARTQEDLFRMLLEAKNLQTAGTSTLIEVHCTPEMGAPFRSDAMSCPTRHLPKYAHLTTTEANYERQFTE